MGKGIMVGMFRYLGACGLGQGNTGMGGILLNLGSGELAMIPTSVMGKQTTECCKGVYHIIYLNMIALHCLVLPGRGQGLDSLH